MSIASMTGFAREAGIDRPVSSGPGRSRPSTAAGLEVRVRTPPGFDAHRRGGARADPQGAHPRPGPAHPHADAGGDGARRSGSTGRCCRRSSTPLATVEVPGNVEPASIDGLLAVRGVVEVDEEVADPAHDAALAEALRGGVAALIESLKAARLGEGQALAARSRRSRSARSSVSSTRRTRRRRAGPRRSGRGSRRRSASSSRAGPASTRTACTRRPCSSRPAPISARSSTACAPTWRPPATSSPQGGPVGRRLDFLAQEFGREANTLCAKANDVSLSRIGLDLKAVVEQFREQVQNVE